MSAEQNRQQFPLFAKVVDEYRRVFGEVKVIRVTENGKTLQRKEPKA